MNSIRISKPSLEDSARIGELIYTVDPFIYPPLFGSPIAARESMSLLMSIPNSPFAVDHILIARLDGEIAGVSVYYTEPFSETPDLSPFYSSVLTPSDSCEDVCNRYLIPMCAELKPDQVYIACIATDVRFRKRGVATALMNSIIDTAAGKRLLLDVLEANTNAIAFYEKLGFVIESESLGYAYKEPRPKVYRMVFRQKSCDDR